MLNLNFGEAARSKSCENQIISSKSGVSFDWLLFFDSRGLGVEYPEQIKSSTLLLLKSYFESVNQSYLIISRPFYLTIFPSLVQFIRLNTHLKFNKLITNMGFVDTTPKKASVLTDSLHQLNSLGLIGKVHEFEEYELSNGSSEILSTIQYTPSTIQNIATSIAGDFSNLFFINTPIIREDYKLLRKRPPAFYSQLKVANHLINQICSACGSEIIDTNKLQIETYDGVHYTMHDHQLIYDAIIEGIQI